MPQEVSTPNRRIKYTRLVEQLQNDIAAGTLSAGDRLPPFAELEEQFKVTPNTVNRALRELETQGLIVREQGRGIFVAKRKPRTATGIIGVLGAAFEDSQRYTYFAQLVHGIRRASTEAHLELLLLSRQTSIHWEKIDGVMIVGSRTKINFAKLPKSMPSVALLSPFPQIASVYADDYQGSFDATQHLITLGHKRIAFLSLGYDYFSMRRLEGYQAALRRAEIPFRKELVRSLTNWSEETQFRGQGYDTMALWLKDNWRDLNCTAILAHNDPTAVGVIEALKAAEIEVPQQVSVVGFDGVADDGYWSSQLTTVRVPLREIGERGIQCLLQQITKTDTATSSEVLPTQLVVRETTTAASG